MRTRRRRKLIDPANWASRKPFGMGEGRPNNYRELWLAARENRDQLRYAWRILRHGTCDGCALGTKGMRDWTMREVHLCNVRLRLLRLNTMPPIEPSVLSDVEALRGLRGAQLRALGRVPYPMLRRRGEPGFSEVSWDEALDRIASAIREAGPDRVGAYLTSRGTVNETYYAAQKAMRAIGVGSIDNAARICHSPSTFGLKEALGVAATTCSYSDWIGSDLVVFIGSNPANNQPVSMKYLYHAKKAGTKVVSVNPYREPGMERYWVPSNVESAVFGTKITDRFFLIGTGGDIGFLNGTLKHMIENGWLAERFIERHTSGYEQLVAALAGQSWEELAALAGTSSDEMYAFARMLHEADRAVLVWSMGVTQHAEAEDTVRAIINLGLAKGYVGREGCGLMPIRGHSGVQGGAEMGAYATALPGGLPVTERTAAQLGRVWGFEVPDRPGRTAPEMIDAAFAGELDVFISSGGNFLEVLPDPTYCASALARMPLRVHIDICLSSQMLTEPGEEVLVLPAQTRYEVAGGVTETSTERRIIFSPQVEAPSPVVAAARPEWQIFTELAARARPELADAVRFAGTAAIREEIAQVVPMYAGIETLQRFGDSVQYGGPHLCAGWQFPTADGKAHFSAVPLPKRAAREPDEFVLATRRGKQFNSMVQERQDALTGAARESVLINSADADRLGLADGDAVTVSSSAGSLPGRIMLAPMASGNVQMHWPEAEVLLDRRRRSPQARIPDYNAVVRIARR
ncbi:MAG: FdhF/YdeP family oxidoreductase [Actinomycetes bacterium]